MLYKVIAKEGLTLPFKFIKYNKVFDASKFPIPKAMIFDWEKVGKISKVKEGAEESASSKTKQKSLLNDEEEIENVEEKNEKVSNKK